MNHLGDLKIDTLWPLALGLLIGVWRVLDGGELWALLGAPVLTWCVWQVARWAERTWRQP